MRILVCNLDPAWDFINWTWRHGVDLYGDPDVTLWDASGQGGLPALHWPDVLPADALAGRLLEYRESGEVLPELVVMLAGLAAPLDPIHLKILSDMRADGGKYILLSTAQYSNEVAVGTASLNQFDAILLSKHNTKREHYYLFRLLLEVLRSPKQVSSVLASQGAVLEAEILWRDADKQTDRVVQQWPGYVTELLTYYEAILRCDADAEGAGEFEAAVDVYLGEVTALLERLPPEVPETAEDAMLPDVDTPLFYRPSLLASIDRACRRFYDSLREMLYAWYARLKSEHDDQAELMRREGDVVLSQLEGRAASIRQTLHRDAVRICENIRKVLKDDWMPRVHARLDDDLAVMQGSRAPRPSWLQPRQDKPSTLASFVMPWFQEDERLDRSRKTVRQSARALAGWNWFWGAPVVVAVLAVLPVTTRVLTEGPPFGWLDAAWVATFILLMLGSQLLYAVLGRRRLRRHVDALRNATGHVRTRHLRAVQASYRYMHAREALRRLVQLDRVCRRYLEELQVDIDEVSRHQAFLKELAEYFNSAGLASVPAMERGEWGMDGQPRTWLATMLNEYVQRASPTTSQKLRIRVSNVTGQDKVFDSYYLEGVDTLTISMVLAAP